MESDKGTDKRRWREIGYGLRDGLLVHIADVESGLACQCVCAACGERLVARKGRKRRHHFAHHVRTGCEGGSETILHRLAKEIVLSLPYIIVPPYDFRREKQFRYGKSVIHTERLAAGGKVPIDAVRLEAPYPGVRPDIEIESQGKRLFVEIEVSHSVDQLKRRRLRAIDVPTIAIVLMEEDAMLPREALTEQLRDDLFSKQWVYHPRESGPCGLLSKVPRESESLPATGRDRTNATACVVKGGTAASTWFRRHRWQQALWPLR